MTGLNGFHVELQQQWEDPYGTGHVATGTGRHVKWWVLPSYPLHFANSGVSGLQRKYVGRAAHQHRNWLGGKLAVLNPTATFASYTAGCGHKFLAEAAALWLSLVHVPADIYIQWADRLVDERDNRRKYVGGVSPAKI